MRISLQTVITGVAVVLITVGILGILGIFWAGIRHEQAQEITKAIAPAEATVEGRPCSEPLDTYLMKAYEYLNVCPRSHGCTDTSTSALAWMQYYQICSERQRVEAQTPHRISDDRP